MSASIDFDLCRQVLADETTAVFIGACMQLGASIVILSNLGRTEDEIRASFEGALQAHLGRCHPSEDCPHEDVPPP